jgi:hypothetical protein
LVPFAEIWYQKGPNPSNPICNYWVLHLSVKNQVL